MIPSWDTASFSVLRPEWPHSFLTNPTPIFFNQLFISRNLHQHAKNQAFSSFCSGDIANLKNTAFWLVKSILAHIPGTKFFWSKRFVQEYSKYITFLYSTNTKKKKKKTKFPNKFEKPFFWPISPFLGAKSFFSKNSNLSRTTIHGPLTPCWVSVKKIMNQSQENFRTEGWKDRSTEGRTDPNS